MKNPVFTGAAVAIITPMYEDGSINFDELGRIIEDQIARGTDAIVICGTTGECSTMTDEEQLAAIKFTVETVNHRVPVIAGAGSNDTDHGCALAAKSAACGADALLLVTPYYNKTTQTGLVAHFTAMAEAGGIPVILYNVPSRTGLNITPETALELSRNPLINGITIKIKKPWAPVGLPLETVAVETTRKWHTAYIALGSNLGEKKNYLDVAIEELKAVKGIEIESVSDWIETEPYGYLDQPNFLNGCACLRTWLEPFALLDVLQSIEAKAGRERKIHWGPRTLDLDLLFYDDQILGTKRLIVPHPEIEKRSFVLVPMAQIAPWLRHPVSKSTIKQLLEELNAEQ